MITEPLNAFGQVIAIWLLWELGAFIIAHPVKDGKPNRPPVSLGDYLWYNPGVLLDYDS